MIDPQTTILFRVRGLSLAIDKYAKHSSPLFQKQPMSKLQGIAAGFLFQHRDQEVYQRDLEAALGVSKSTVSGLVKRMEKNGVIVTAPGADVRYKRILLTKESIRQMTVVDAAAQKMEADLKVGISEADLATFFSVLEKIKKNTE